MKPMVTLFLGWLSTMAFAAPTLKVVATTPDLADLARHAGGDRVQVTCLSRGFQDPHFVEAKPSLILKLREADLFIQTGLELEIGWAPLLVQGSRNPRIQLGAPGFLEASQFIQPLEVPATVSRSEGDIHPGGNPHYLGDPENALLVLKGIAQALGRLDPPGAAVYEKNAEEYHQKLSAKIVQWDARMGSAKGALFVSYHKNVIYFARHFGLVSVGEIEPKPGIPPTPAHTEELIQLIKAQRVSLILTMPQYEQRTAESLAHVTGARIVKLALVPEAVPEAVDYIAAMDYNVTSILKALQP